MKKSLIIISLFFFILACSDQEETISIPETIRIQETVIVEVTKVVETEKLIYLDPTYNPEGTWTPTIGVVGGSIYTGIKSEGIDATILKGYSDFNIFFYSSIVASIIAIIVIRIQAKKLQETQGKQIPVFLISIGLIFILPLLSFLIGGVKLSFEIPQLKQLAATSFVYDGGLSLPQS